LAIFVSCQCGARFQTRDENAGRRAACPECDRELVIPEPKPLTEDDRAALERLGTVTSGRATASLILGVLSLVLLFFTGVPAIVLGWLGIRDIRQGRGRIRGAGMALAGIILGLVGSTVISMGALKPAVVFLIERSHVNTCREQLRRIGQAMRSYHEEHGSFPAATIRDAKGQPLLSWRVSLLPYLGPECAALYGRFHLDEPWDGPNNGLLLRQMPDVYRCPTGGGTTYQVVIGPGTMFTGLKPLRSSDASDGTATTILVGESATPVPWTSPEDIPYDPSLAACGLGSAHPGEFNVLLVDGSVQSLPKTISRWTMQSLLSRDGGEYLFRSSLPGW
jgi:hypothetical protein